MNNSEKTILYAKSLASFYAMHKRMPSYSEMLKIFRVKSKNTVFKRVHHLIEKGILEKDSRGKIIPRRLPQSLKILGIVAAGFPSPAEEELVDTMNLDEYLIKNPQATYLLKVDGDSMLDAGIHPGDLVLVQKNLTTKIGDIVVAQVDGEWTLKYFDRKNRKVMLKSANKKYPTIIPRRELIIAGVVIANVRKYR